MTILVIDDDQDDLDIFQEIIHEINSSIRCLLVNDPVKGLLILENVIPDVIFVDYNMPVMNGMEFITNVRKKDDLKNIPMIIHSTSFHLRRAEALIAGSVQHIKKATEFTEAVKNIKSALTYSNLSLP